VQAAAKQLALPPNQNGYRTFLFGEFRRFFMGDCCSCDCLDDMMAAIGLVEEAFRRERGGEGRDKKGEGGR